MTSYYYMYYFFSKMLSKQVMILRIAGDSIYILGTGKKAPLKQASGKISDPTRNKAPPPFFWYILSGYLNSYSKFEALCFIYSVFIYSVHGI